MCVKRVFALGMTALLVFALPVLPVSAHGCHHRTAAKADAVCEVCTVKECEETGLHIHDEKMYCGYDHESGYCDGSCKEECDDAGSSASGKTLPQAPRARGGHHKH